MGWYNDPVSFSVERGLRSCALECGELLLGDLHILKRSIGEVPVTNSGVHLGERVRGAALVGLALLHLDLAQARLQDSLAFGLSLQQLRTWACHKIQPCCMASQDWMEKGYLRYLQLLVEFCHFCPKMPNLLTAPESKCPLWNFRISRMCPVREQPVTQIIYHECNFYKNNLVHK